MTTLAWFHCFSGIAGDMALGALVDAGADLDELRALLGRLPLRGWALQVEPVLRGGIAATRVEVRTTEHAVVRTYAHLSALVDEARLPERVRGFGHVKEASLRAVEARWAELAAPPAAELRAAE